MHTCSVRAVFSDRTLCYIEVSAEIEVPGPAPIPVPPIPIPPPIEDEGPWIEYGKCKVDYNESIFGKVLWWIIEKNWLDEDLVLEHHDAYTTRFFSPEDVEDLDEYQARGFYALASDWKNWILKIAAWLDGEVYYVKGEMIDKTRDSDTCEKWGAGWERDQNRRTVSEVLYRYEMPWDKFHLVMRNCQHWAMWAITGQDDLSQINPLRNQ